MPTNIKSTTIIITLEGSEKLKTEKVSRKQSEQASKRTWGLKYIFLVRQNLHFSLQMHHNFRQNNIFLPQATWLVKAMTYFVYNNQKLKSSSKF